MTASEMKNKSDTALSSFFPSEKFQVHTSKVWKYFAKKNHFSILELSKFFSEEALRTPRTQTNSPIQFLLVSEPVVTGGSYEFESHLK